MGFSVTGALEGAAAGSSAGWMGAAAGGLAGGFLSGDEADKSANSARALNAANIQLAHDTMDWEERMSSTAHQREVADLRAAGLNPILSATKLGGASTPLGIMPSQVNPDVNQASDKAAMRAVMINSARTLSESLLNAESAKTQKTQQAVNLAQAANLSGQFKFGGVTLPLRNLVSGVQRGWSALSNWTSKLMNSGKP